MASPINIADETALRAAIKADVETIAVVGNVFTRRRLVNSKADFIAKLAKYPGVDAEIRFLEIDLVNIEDGDEGPDDCPVAILTYNFHLFHQFADGRADGSNSDHDFNDALLLLRTLFLLREKYDVSTGLTRGVVEMGRITPAEFAQFGNDGFVDCVGHSKDLTLKAVYYV